MFINDERGQNVPVPAYAFKPKSISQFGDPPLQVAAYFFKFELLKGELIEEFFVA